MIWFYQKVFFTEKGDLTAGEVQELWDGVEKIKLIT
jgi:hypothetical protein